MNRHDKKIYSAAGESRVMTSEEWRAFQLLNKQWRNKLEEQKQVQRERNTRYKFSMIISERETFLTNRILPVPWEPAITNLFTDGSKFDFGTEAAYIIFRHIHRSHDYIHLDEHTTVFQAEIIAFNMACNGPTRS